MRGDALRLLFAPPTAKEVGGGVEDFPVDLEGVVEAMGRVMASSSGRSNGRGDLAPTVAAGCFLVMPVVVLPRVDC